MSRNNALKFDCNSNGNLINEQNIINSDELNKIIKSNNNNNNNNINKNINNNNNNSELNRININEFNRNKNTSPYNNSTINDENKTNKDRERERDRDREAPQKTLRHDAERMRKKFRDAIYVGNVDRVHRIICSILDHNILDLNSVLLPYASRHVTPIGLAARRGHVRIVDLLIFIVHNATYNSTNNDDSPSIEEVTINNKISTNNNELINHVNVNKTVVPKQDNNDDELEIPDIQDISQHEDSSDDLDKDKDKQAISPKTNKKKDPKDVISLTLNNDKKL